MADENELLLRLKAIDELTPVMLAAMQSMATAAAGMTDALEALKKKQGENEEAGGKLNARFINLSAVMNVGKQVVEGAKKAWEMMSEQIGHAIEEAEEAERAENKLNGALVSNGKYTIEAANALEEYTKATEDATGVSGEFIKTAIANGVQMGLSIEKSKQLEEAARKLAATQGMDLNSALSLVQASLAGQTRGLAKIFPEVKNLTEAQLKQGGALEIVNKQLAVQYGTHLKGYATAIAKAQNELSNVYEEVGKIIIQNPLVIKGINVFTEAMKSLQKGVQAASEWITENQSTIQAFGNALMKAGAVIVTAFGLWAAGAALAAGPTAILAASVALLTSPITLTVAAVAALTAAFYKWPGLFDIIQGALKEFVGRFVSAIGVLVELTGKFAGIISKDMQQSMEGLSAKLGVYAASWSEAGQKQQEAGFVMNQTITETTEHVKGQEDATKKLLETQSKQVAVNMAVAQSYGPVLLANDAVKKSEEALVSVRDQSLKNFEEFLNRRGRLAVTKQQEEELQVQLHYAKLLGDTELGHQQQIAANEMQFQVEMAQKIAQMQAMGVAEDQINAFRVQAKADHFAQLNVQEEDYFISQQQKAEREQKFQQAQFFQLQALRKKHGTAMGTLQMVSDSSQLNATKGIMDTTSQLMASKNKDMFEIGKKAAIANATISMFQSAVGAFNSMIGIPFIGPVLATAAAAAAIAAGTVQIANIKSQKFDAGGQADSGMDSVPQSLSGKSFVLSQGERVVQPEANKDLTAFLNKEKMNPDSVGGGGKSYNITLNYQGNGSQDDARKMAEMVVKQIRDMSERGQPIMSEKGLVKS